jgi:hypothetical protein
MSKPEPRKTSSRGTSLERSMEQVLSATRSLPSNGEVLIDDPADDEDRILLGAILNA